MYGLKMSPNNSLMVVCGGEVVVTAVHNVAATIDVASIDGVVIVVGAAAVVVVWVQQ